MLLGQVSAVLRLLILIYVTSACLYCLIGATRHTELPARMLNWTRYNTKGSINWQQELIRWSNPSGTMFKQNDHDPFMMQESLFLSKAFDSSIKPSQIIPYYFKASGPQGNGQIAYSDITILTLVTSNRFLVLRRLAQRYKGPISVAIHVTASSLARRDEILNQLHDLYVSTPEMATWVDVHLILDNFDRQFNLWRNVARFLARTEFVMMLDVDFAVCTDFRRRLMRNPAMLDKLREGTTAFVIPAFEFSSQSDGRDAETFPRTKKDLAALFLAQKIDVFHHAWEGGHNSTHYRRYFESSPGDIYKVQVYQHAYEPYIIFSKEGPPWCDERFVGYGGNKAACLYEMHLSGISFFVLSDDFLIHQSHQYEEDARKAERRYNKKLYNEFREECCLRNLHKLIVTKTLSTEIGMNIQTECQKIRGVSALAVEMIRTMQ